MTGTINDFRSPASLSPDEMAKLMERKNSDFREAEQIAREELKRQEMEAARGPLYSKRHRSRACGNS